MLNIAEEMAALIFFFLKKERNRIINKEILGINQKEALMFKTHQIMGYFLLLSIM